MKFDTPATTNPIDQLKVIGKPTDRIEGPLKTTGTAPYAYERHDVAAHPAYGHIVPSAIAKGRTTRLGCWPVQRLSTTTRRLRLWWRKRLSRRAQRRASCGWNTTRRTA